MHPLNVALAAFLHLIDITDRCNDIDLLNRLDNRHSAATNYQPDMMCHRGNIPSGAGLLCVWLD